MAEALKAKALTTEEVKRLLKPHFRYYPKEKRELFLPTREQLKVVIAFLKASELCESVRGMEKGVPKRALCVGEKIKEILPEVERWAVMHRKDFEELYRKTAWEWRYV